MGEPRREKQAALGWRSTSLRQPPPQLPRRISGNLCVPSSSPLGNTLLKVLELDAYLCRLRFFLCFICGDRRLLYLLERNVVEQGGSLAVFKLWCSIHLFACQ